MRRSNGLIYTIEGTPFVYRAWNGRDVPIAMSMLPEWHENRDKAHEEAWANLNHIVRCWNSHDALLAFAEAYIKTFRDADRLMTPLSECRDLYSKAMLAIAAAEGKMP